MLTLACFLAMQAFSNTKTPLQKTDYSGVYEMFPMFRYEQVAVRLTDTEGDMCSGFLISEDIIITAGHCADTKPNTQILAMDYHRNPLGVATLLYKEGEEFDIAVLKLKEKVKTIKPILKLDCKNASLRSNDPSKYFIVYVIGYPRGVLTPTVKSLFSLVETKEYQAIAYGLVDLGSSGSMVISSQGDLLGVISAINLIGEVSFTIMSSRKGLCDLFKRKKGERNE